MEALQTLAGLLVTLFEPSVSLGLVLWLIFGAIAARFNLSGWWRRCLIVERARALNRPPREILLARQRHEGELVALLVQLAFISVGLVVATLPPPLPPPGTPTPWQSLLVVPALVLVQVALAWESWRQHRYDRTRAHTPPDHPEPDYPDRSDPEGDPHELEL